MMETVRIESDERGVATLWLARPEKRNAMSARMIAELTEAAARLAEDNAIRAVVLAAEGSVFCAGGDLGWMQDQMAADGETRRREAMALATMLKALNELPKPLIGRVHGNAFGGGVGLISVCDVAVAVETARFGLTETRLGLIPATIGPYVVARMGEGMARRVFMSARVFDAEEAVALGLIRRLVPEEDLDQALEDEVSPYLDCAPGAVAEAKALALRLGASPGEAEIAASIDALVTRWETAEAREGTEAFFAKRKATWMAGT
ncbi:crotonase/enoyl-CoA hydratase family protein [Silicimonas sp. MF1-12-2]|uniref:crotonase/enoyl-CoA hydratase family protein n=1 Tax=Silicimonas sp. MF1-12-2 TaxID=3384793 RepID=UPI0039B48681